MATFKVLYLSESGNSALMAVSNGEPQADEFGMVMRTEEKVGFVKITDKFKKVVGDTFENAKVAYEDVRVAESVSKEGVVFNWLLV